MEVRARTGMPESLARHDMGLSTMIGRADIDASGNKLDPTMRTRMNRLATWDMRSQLHSPTCFLHSFPQYCLCFHL
jgi:transcription initiation factor TFIIB